MGKRYVATHLDNVISMSTSFCTAQPREEIEITLPDGSKRKGTSWETSPMDIAKEISKGLADRIVISKVSSRGTYARTLSDLS